MPDLKRILTSLVFATFLSAQTLCAEEAPVPLQNQEPLQPVRPVTPQPLVPPFQPAVSIVTQVTPQNTVDFLQGSSPLSSPFDPDVPANSDQPSSQETEANTEPSLVVASALDGAPYREPSHNDNPLQPIVISPHLLDDVQPVPSSNSYQPESFNTNVQVTQPIFDSTLSSSSNDILYGEPIPVESGIVLPVLSPPVPYVRESNPFSGTASASASVVPAPDPSAAATGSSASNAQTSSYPGLGGFYLYSYRTIVENVERTQDEVNQSSNSKKDSMKTKVDQKSTDAGVLAAQDLQRRLSLQSFIDSRSQTKASPPVVFSSIFPRSGGTKSEKDEKAKKGKFYFSSNENGDDDRPRFQSRFSDLILKTGGKTNSDWNIVLEGNEHDR